MRRQWLKSGGRPREGAAGVLVWLAGAGALVSLCLIGCGTGYGATGQPVASSVATPQTLREAGERVDAVATLSSRVRAVLETPEQRVVLRGALVVSDGTLRGAGEAGRASGVRLRLTKAGQNVLDLTRGDARVFLLASRDFEARAGAGVGGVGPAEAGGPSREVAGEGGVALSNPTARSRARLPELAEALTLAVGWPAMGPTLETEAGLLVAETEAGDAAFEYEPATGAVRVYPWGRAGGSGGESGALLTLTYRPGRVEDAEVLVLRGVVVEAGDLKLSLRLTEPSVNGPLVAGVFTPPPEAEPL